MCVCAADKRTDFTARNLANFLWGLAKIEHHPGEQMLVNLAAEVAKKIDGANAQNLVSAHSPCGNSSLKCPICYTHLLIFYSDQSLWDAWPGLPVMGRIASVR